MEYHRWHGKFLSKSNGQYSTNCYYINSSLFDYIKNESNANRAGTRGTPPLSVNSNELDKGTYLILCMYQHVIGTCSISISSSDGSVATELVTYPELYAHAGGCILKIYKIELQTNSIITLSGNCTDTSFENAMAMIPIKVK